MYFYNQVGYINSSGEYKKILTLNDNGWYLASDHTFNVNNFQTINGSLTMFDSASNPLITINGSSISFHSTNVRVDTFTFNNLTINSISPLDNLSVNKPIRISSTSISSEGTSGISITNLSTKKINILLQDASLTTNSVRFDRTARLLLPTVTGTFASVEIS